MTIDRIDVREIFDSRGESTIEVGVAEGGTVSRAAIPSGRSRGTREAAVLPFEQARAAANGPVRRTIVGKTFDSIQELDTALRALDGTAGKTVLGGNLMLGISAAHARNLAAIKGQELWQLLRDEFFGGKTAARPPLIFANLVNGGSHASNNLAFQEYLVVARTALSVTATIRDLIRFYVLLGDVLKERHRLSSLPVGDEEGYALDFRDNFEPLSLMNELIEKARLTDRFSLGLDIAASEFWKEGRYRFEGRARTTAEMADIYGRHFANVQSLVSVEDPFAEGDIKGFKDLRERFPEKLIIGDDLTVTDPLLVEEYAKAKCISGVIIKPNQVGTLTESCMAMKVAHERGVQTVVSHRSGETDDTLIIHLAKAGSAEGVKIGAPHNERMVKYDELIRLYE